MNVAWALVALALVALAVLAGCAPAQPFFSPPPPATPPAAADPLPAGWRLRDGPAAVPGRTVQILERPARAAPARYRLLVLPGSGCTGFAPIAARYFAGALHAQVQVLHKPGAMPGAGAAPTACTPAFHAGDRLDLWQVDAQAALAALHQADGDAPLPTLLVGISEGAELLPALAPQIPHLAGLVLLSASGLDPHEAGALQAERLGAGAQWQALGAQVLGPGDGAQWVQGRRLDAWRVLWSWRMSQALIDGPWPLLQVWGSADALVPPRAYARFAERAQARTAPWCQRVLSGADHGLQGPQGDGVQTVWAWLERWARQPAPQWCP